MGTKKYISSHLPARQRPLTLFNIKNIFIKLKILMFKSRDKALAGGDFLRRALSIRGCQAKAGYLRWIGFKKTKSALPTCLVFDSSKRAGRRTKGC